MTHAMHKKTMLLAVLAVVLVLALGVAICLSVDWSEKAGADESLVLEGNTADYSFINDHSHDGKNLWKYSRSKNEWTTSDDRSFGAGEDKASVLTLKVTKAGDIAFQWKVGTSSSTAFAIRHYTEVPEDGNLETAKVEWVFNKGAQETFTAGTACFGSEENYQGKLTNATTYQEAIVSNCQVGDYVTISFMTTGSSRYAYYMNVKGLKVPDTQFTITARMAEGQTELGSIKTEKEGEVSSEDGVLEVKRGYEESVTFTAVPQDGYVAYWQDSAGKKVSSTEITSVTAINEKKDNTELVVYFVDISTIDYKSTQDEEGNDYFVKSSVNDIDRYSLDFSVFKGDAVSTAKLEFALYIPKGGAYFTFDYVYSTEHNLSNVYFCVDGIQQGGSNSQFSNKPRFSAVNTWPSEADEPITSTYVQWFAVEGYYNAYFSILTYLDVSEQDVFYFENPRICSREELMFDEITFSDNPEFTTLKISYDGYEQKTIESDVPVSVPRGLAVKVLAEQKVKEKASALDSNINVNLYFDNFTANYTDENGENWSFKKTSRNSIRTQDSKSYYFVLHNDETIGTMVSQNNSEAYYKLPDGEIKVQVQYIEDAPIAISATKTTNNDSDIIDIHDGDAITFPFHMENSLFVRVNTFSKYTAENYKIVINDEIYPSGSLQSMDDVIGFALSNVQNSRVKISYSDEPTEDEQFIYKGISISFTVAEVAESGLDSILKSDGLVVTNDLSLPWTFDPENSEIDNYAYRAGSSVIISQHFSNVNKYSALTFQMKDEISDERGSLSFEFKLDGLYGDFISITYGARLIYKVGAPFTNDEYRNAIDTEQLPEGINLIAEVVKDDVVQTGSGVVKNANGWYQASIGIEKGQPIYVAFVSGKPAYSMADSPWKDSFMCIRNARLNVGTAVVTVERSAEAAGTITSIIGSDEHQDSDSKVTFEAAPVGSILTATAKPLGDEVFYGWSVNGEFVSAETTISVFVDKDLTIVGYMAQAGTYVARTEGVFYTDLGLALKSARDNQTVAIVKNEVVISENLTIPENVTLLLPYNEAGGFTEAGTTSNATNQISWYGTKYNEAYITVRVTNNATITVNGALYVGGVASLKSGQGYQGHTSGAYSQIILEKGSKINVTSSGVMDVYGRVWGGEGKTGTDMGSIEVENGGKVYEPFIILDFAGGSNALGSFTNQTTPFKRYAMINIEVPFTIEYGAQLVGHASLYVPSMNLLASLDQPFISYDMGDGKGGDGKGHDTFVMLHKGSILKITYDKNKTVKTNIINTDTDDSLANCTEGIGKTTMTFEGGATFSYMLFSAMGLNVPTMSVMFSIPYNFDVVLNKGTKSGEEIAEDYNTYETKTDFMLMPGATVTVGEGATLLLNANTWVLDGYAGGSQAGKHYPSADELESAGYTRGANLIVNGTLKVGQKTTTAKFDIFGSDDVEVGKLVPAVFVGTVQTTGETGRIVLPEGTVVTDKIWSGLEGQDYFAYTATARVWDKVHNCFGNLVAGHNYTATGGDSFKPEEDSILYTTTKDGEENLLLELGRQLFGSWKVEHSEHKYDWTPSEEDGKPTAEDRYVQLTRKCTELGCEETGNKDLFLAPENLGSVTYKGEVYSKEDVLELLAKAFNLTVEEKARLEKMFSLPELPDILGVNDYRVTVQLVNGFWLEGEQYTEGNKSFTLTVTAQNIAADAVTVDELSNVEYNGNAQQQQVTLHFNGQVLQSGQDYSVQYSNDATNAGDVTVTITGQGNFSGTRTVTYNITAKQLTNENVKLVGVGDVTYDAKEHKPTPTAVQVDNITLPLENVTFEYSSEDSNNCINAGTVTIKVTPKNTNNFTGSAEVTFKITPASAANAQVNVSGEYRYTGEAQQPKDKVTVTLAGFELTDSDYDVSFSSNVEPGEAVVTVTFKGNFDGKAEGRFTIGKCLVESLEIKGVEQSYEYTGEKLQPQVTVTHNGKQLTLTEDYTVSYGANLDVGQGTVTVTGAGEHYDGSKQITFSITAKEASAAKVTVSGSYVYNAKEQAVKVDVELSGFSFVEGKDYDVVYADSADRTNAGKVSFSVQFKGNFSGKVESLSFEIAKAAVKVTPDNAESPEGEKQAALNYKLEGELYGSDEQTLKAALTVQIENNADVTQGKAGATYNIVVVYSAVAELDKNYSLDVSAKGTYTILAAVFKDVVFEDSTVEYNGQEHGITATNLPVGAKATYEYKQGESKLNGQPKAAGTYSVTVTVTLESYNPYVVTRTLTISAKKVQVTVSDQKVTYNGKAQSAKSEAGLYSVPAGAIVAGDEVNFALSSSSLTAVGSVAITLTVSGAAKDNYSITSNTAHFSVEALAIAKEGVQVTSTHVYNGKEQTPTLKVTAGGLELADQTDYTVTLQEGRVNAGDYTVTVQAKGNFSGSVQVSFTIAKAKLTGVVASGDAVFNNNEKTPALEVSAEGGLSVAAGDYSVSYNGDRTNVGSFTVEVTATGSNYQGSVSAQFTITPAAVDSVVVSGEYTYNGTEQKPVLVVKAGELVLTEEDYDVSIEGDGSLTNAGTVVLRVKAKGNFSGERTASVTIKAATVDSVEVTSTHEYNGKAHTPTVVVKAGQLTLEEKDFRLSVEGNSTNSGTVNFTVDGQGNFAGRLTGSFTIATKKVSVTVEDKSSVYGDEYEELTYTFEGLVNDSDLIMDNFVKLSCEELAKERAAADTYNIVCTVTQPERNYTIEVVAQGHYTVSKRDISVTVSDQGDTYGYGKEYSFNAEAWKVTEGQLLEGDVLLTLVKPQFVNAGDYDIDANITNGNYNVTLTKGTYKLAKLHVEHDGDETLFILSVDGEEFNEDNPELYRYSGEDFVLTATVFVTEGGQPKALETKLSVQALSEPGVYEVKVEIDDPNYEGSRTFSVEVVGEDGYSQKVHDLLEALNALVGELTVNTLTTSEEHFAIVHGIVEKLNTLTEQERTTYAEALAKYVELVEAWNGAASLSADVVSTAHAIADAPIRWLFAAASLNALLAAMFVLGKGGLF